MKYESLDILHFVFGMMLLSAILFYLLAGGIGLYLDRFLTKIELLGLYITSLILSTITISIIISKSRDD